MMKKHIIKIFLKKNYKIKLFIKLHLHIIENDIIILVPRVALMCERLGISIKSKIK